jgi:hypothetical protein
MKSKQFPRDPDVRNHLTQIIMNPIFQDKWKQVLYKLCSVDTSPKVDIEQSRIAEEQVFQQIQDVLESFQFPSSSIERHPINPAIQSHPAFSNLHYTITPENPLGLDPHVVYKNRYNLLYIIQGDSTPNGRNPALNAHVDVVAPYFPPQIEDSYLIGRGAVDDKGNVCVILGALDALQRYLLQTKQPLRNRITSMFVIEEETGGNGSLSLAVDKGLRQMYDSMMVFECTEKNIHPANRGAVWFKVDTLLNHTTNSSSESCSLLEALFYAIRTMQEEGMKIKAESDHPLFPHRPVQTCNGILGPFGEHPSRICGYFSCLFTGDFAKKEWDTIESLLQQGLHTYLHHFGDKTQELNPETGLPKVEQHYILRTVEDSVYELEVFGSTGHMGSLPENDAAITKAAYMLVPVIQYRIKNNLPPFITLKNHSTPSSLSLEGGQGFLPTHTIDTIQSRLQAVCNQGITQYTKEVGVSPAMITATTTFDKLHNTAFEGDSHAPSMQVAWQTGIELGTITPDQPIRGWDVSCDARLFATEYPELPVLTTGVGSLRYAHADGERCYLPDLFQMMLFAALYLIRETHTLDI